MKWADSNSIDGFIQRNLPTCRRLVIVASKVTGNTVTSILKEFGKPGRNLRVDILLHLDGLNLLRGHIDLDALTSLIHGSHGRCRANVYNVPGLAARAVVFDRSAAIIGTDFETGGAANRAPLLAAIVRNQTQITALRQRVKKLRRGNAPMTPADLQAHARLSRRILGCVTGNALAYTSDALTAPSSSARTSAMRHQATRSTLAH